MIAKLMLSYRTSGSLNLVVVSCCIDRNSKIVFAHAKYKFGQK